MLLCFPGSEAAHPLSEYLNTATPLCCDRAHVNNLFERNNQQGFNLAHIIKAGKYLSSLPRAASPLRLMITNFPERILTETL